MDAAKWKKFQENQINKFRKEVLDPLYEHQDKLEEELVELKELSGDAMSIIPCPRPATHNEYKDVEKLIVELKAALNAPNS